VQQQHRIVGVSGGIAMWLAQRDVVQLECGERFAGPEFELGKPDWSGWKPQPESQPQAGKTLHAGASKSPQFKA
jgi:hypothetical protein